MCRHLGYLGEAQTLASAVTGGPTSLYHQSYEPRLQRHGTVNADGWGIGWFTERPGDGPARHRSARPIWTRACDEQRRVSLTAAQRRPLSMLAMP